MNSIKLYPSNFYRVKKKMQMKNRMQMEQKFLQDIKKRKKMLELIFISQ